MCKQERPSLFTAFMASGFSFKRKSMTPKLEELFIEFHEHLIPCRHFLVPIFETLAKFAGEDLC